MVAHRKTVFLLPTSGLIGANDLIMRAAATAMNCGEARCGRVAFVGKIGSRRRRFVPEAPRCFSPMQNV